MRIVLPLLVALVSLVVRATSDDDVEIETMERLDPSDSARLASAFFSGEPWLIYCEKKLAAESSQFVKFQKASKRLRSVNFAVLDCSAKLPSGKTTLKKFKIDGKTKPVLIFCANGDKPVRLAKGDFSSKKGSTKINVTTLVDAVRTKIKPRVYAVTQKSTLQKRCFSKRACGMVLHQRAINGVDGRIVHELMMMHRNVSFVTIDTAQYKFSLESKLPAVAKVEGGKKKKVPPRFVFFKPWQNISGMQSIKAKYNIPYERESSSSDEQDDDDNADTSDDSDDADADDADDDAEVEEEEQEEQQEEGEEEEQEEEQEEEEEEEEEPAVKKPATASGMAPLVLSLSGRQLRSSDNLTTAEANKFFDKHIVGYTKMVETGPNLMAHPNLLAEIDGRRYPWDVAKHEFAAGFFFGKSLGTSFLERESSRQVKAAMKGDPDGDNAKGKKKKQKKKSEKKMAAKAHTGAFSIVSMDEFLKEAAQVCCVGHQSALHHAHTPYMYTQRTRTHTFTPEGMRSCSRFVLRCACAHTLFAQGQFELVPLTKLPTISAKSDSSGKKKDTSSKSGTKKGKKKEESKSKKENKSKKESKSKKKKKST
jgi:hypothetical protein